MKKHNIGAIQLVILLFVTRTFSTLTLSPQTTSGLDGNAVLLGEIIAVPVTFLLAIPMFLIFKKGERKDIVALGIQNFGKGGYIIGFIYALFLLAALINIVAQFVFFMTNAIFPGASVLSILIVFMIAIMYSTNMGLSGVTRAACIISVFLIIMIVTIFAVGWQQASFINIKPIRETVVYQIVMAVIFSISKDVELVFLMFLYPHIKGNMIRSAWIYILVSFAIMFTATLICVLVFGDYARQLEYPFFTLASVLEFGFLQRIDAIEMIFWVFTAFFRATLCIIALRQILKLILPKKTKPFLVWVIGILSFIGVYIVTYNVRSINAVYKLAIRGIPMFVVFTVIPMIVLILGRKRSGNTK